MRRLIDARLYGEGLVEIRSAELVRRYNAALALLGLPPTSLSSFRVDAMGWSPEIAQEKESFSYLAVGMTNRFAIILTPDQAWKPVYSPFTSYDQALITAYYERYKAEIGDITVGTAIALDIDNQMTLFKNPGELALVDYVVVHSVLGALGEEAARQRKLVEKFNGRSLEWFDAALRAQIIESARRAGDLRYRRVEIPDMKYDGLQCYHTRAFGGVFVFRGIRPKRKVLVLETQDASEADTRLVNAVYSVRDRSIVRTLIDEKLVESGLASGELTEERLTYVLECLVADFLSRACPDLSYLALTSAKKKHLLTSLPDVPSEVHGLEELRFALREGRASDFRVSPKLQLLLLRPRSGLSEDVRQVVEKLLCRLNPLDILRLYHLDKELFFTYYLGWPEPKKEWAVKLILEQRRQEN